MLEKTATLFRPKLIIAGASAYPRDFNYRRMRKVDAVSWGVSCQIVALFSSFVRSHFLAQV